MKYDLFDLLNLSIQLNSSFVIVEGIDDPNDIDDYSSGCDSVIKCVDKLQPKFSEREDNIKRVLGIIDRDVRPYRPLQQNEIDYAALKGLFILKYYSYETYFITKSNLKRLISNMTFLTLSEIDDSILDNIEQQFNSNLEPLFYISIEALKNACIAGYNGIVGYSNDKVKDEKARQYFYNNIESKKSDLIDFSNSLGLSISDIKFICKGKWLLHCFLFYAEKEIKNLQSKCNSNLVRKCKSCAVGNTQDCRYKVKYTFQSSYLENTILEYIDEGECKDILNRLGELYTHP